MDELRRDPRLGRAAELQFPIGTEHAVREAARSLRNLWIWRGVFIISMAILCALLWPEPIVRGEISYVGLQQEAIDGNIKQITIDGETARGTFRVPRSATAGEIWVRGQIVPGEPGDPTTRVNAFIATVPEHTQESFIALLETRGAEVRIISDLSRDQR